MNKIFNWTIGSFFRSIGRILAYIIIGGLIFFLLGKTGFNISDLFFERVDALSLDGTYSRMVNVTQQNGNIRLYNIVGTTVHQTTQVSWTWTNGFNSGTDNYAIFNIQGIEMSTDGGISYQSNNEYAWQNYVVNQFIISVQMMSNGAWQACEFQSNKLICPMFPDVNYTGLFFEFNPLTTTYGYDIRFNVNHYASLYKTDSSAIIQGQQQTTDAITNQTQQQQQQHEELMESNTTQAESEASDFFGNFTTEDHGGINAIITAPLNTIRSLLSSTCTNLVLPLPFVNKNLTLPCMYDIYTQHFGLFFQLYQTIILAIISYRCLRSIFYDINGFTNPDDDRIEVMDL